MKMRNKGKVHPFTASSSSYTPKKESLSVLKLLPSAIFSLVSVLSVEDREVVAYMITKSLKSTNPSFLPAEYKKKGPKIKQSFIDCHGGGHNSPTLFDCDCFHCYTSFWFRWDSSPNRDLIHQAIEAFEEHLSNGEQLNKSEISKKYKRKDKTGRRKLDEKMSAAHDGGVLLEISAAGPPDNQENLAAVPLENEVATAEVDKVEPGCREEELEDDMRASPPSGVVHNHKGLVRKLLPDVMGILNSRLWSLWSPNA